jgi:succinate dehydrogenase/fumarate reductase flavoprotein subunit
MGNITKKKVSTDVLIVGAGGAGTRAAIASAGGGAKTIITAKDLFGHSGCTPVAKGGYGGMQGHPGDDWKVHFQDTVRGGGALNNQKLVEILTKNARTRLLELEEWGAAFDRNEKSEIYLRKFGGHTQPRSAISGDVTGREMMWALKRKCWQNELIEVMDETYITQLLVTDGRIAGAMGVSLATGEIFVFECPVVILANGGSGRLWPITFSTKGKCGDGLRLAYEAGAELVDMEFFQIHPTGWKWPPAVIGRVISEGVRADGGQLLNKNLERFMSKYDPEKLELACRDYVSRCVYKEVTEGRGTEHGGVWLSVTHLPKSHIERRIAAVMETGLVAGVDIRFRAFEVFPEHHYQNGGVKIDEYARTAVEGLYTAGEVAGGVHGGNRLGTNSLSDLLVFGMIAGENGAQYVKNNRPPKIEEHQVEEETKKILRPLEKKGGISPYFLSKKLHDVMWEELHIERTEKGLERCLRVTADVVKHFADVSVPGDSLRYNDAWVTAMEVRARMLVGEIMTRASLYRTESRSALFRTEYPQIDRANWDMNLVVKKEDGKVKLEGRPIVVTIWPLKDIDLPLFPVPGEEHVPGATATCQVDD